MDYGEGEESWSEAWGYLSPEVRDVFFEAGYHQLHARPDAEVRLSVVAEGEQRLLIGGVQTRIPEIWTQGRELFDLHTGIGGYGGPVGAGRMDPSFLLRAWSLWQEKLKAHQVVAAFFRLHPLLENNQSWLSPFATVEMDRYTVFLDLQQDPKTLWQAASPLFRRLVRKAERDSLQVGEGGANGWHEFQRAYQWSMERLGAAPGYRFEAEFFRRLRSFPGSRLLTVQRDGRFQAGVVFLEGPRWLHYHLAARAPEACHQAAAYLIFQGMEMARQRGLDGLFLYAAMTRSLEDPLLIFKRRTGGRLVPGHVARVMVDPEKYGQLVSEWQKASGRSPRYLLGYREPLT